MTENDSKDIVERLKAEGQLVRNTGTNSIKSVNIKLEKFASVFSAISENLHLQTGILQKTFDLNLSEIERIRKNEELGMTREDASRTSGAPGDITPPPVPDSVKEGLSTSFFDFISKIPPILFGAGGVLLSLLNPARIMGFLLRGGVLLAIAPVVGDFVTDFTKTLLEKFGASENFSNMFSSALGESALWATIGSIFSRRIGALFGIGSLLYNAIDGIFDIEDNLKRILENFNISTEYLDGIGAALGAALGFALLKIVPRALPAVLSTIGLSSIVDGAGRGAGAGPSSRGGARGAAGRRAAAEARRPTPRGIGLGDVGRVLVAVAAAESMIRTTNEITDRLAAGETLSDIRQERSENLENSLMEIPVIGNILRSYESVVKWVHGEDNMENVDQTIVNNETDDLARLNNITRSMNTNPSYILSTEDEDVISRIETSNIVTENVKNNIEKIREMNIQRKRMFGIPIQEGSPTLTEVETITPNITPQETRVSSGSRGRGQANRRNDEVLDEIETTITEVETITPNITPQETRVSSGSSRRNRRNAEVSVERVETVSENLMTYFNILQRTVMTNPTYLLSTEDENVLSSIENSNIVTENVKDTIEGIRRNNIQRHRFYGGPVENNETEIPNIENNNETTVNTNREFGNAIQINPNIIVTNSENKPDLNILSENAGRVMTSITLAPMNVSPVNISNGGSTSSTTVSTTIITPGVSEDGGLGRFAS
jgi:hypothetical protein